MPKRSTTICITALAAIAMLMPSATHADIFANKGFETAGTGMLALNWVPADGGYTRTSLDSFAGDWSALLVPPVDQSAVLLQNSVVDGGQPPLVEGSNPLLSFQAKGCAGTTGFAIFALRYLDADGNILSSSGNQFFGTSINCLTWTEITYDLGAVPVGASAAFIEIVLQGGAVANGAIFIDDVKLSVRGDANGDGVFNNLDISSFVMALTNAKMYAMLFPDACPDFTLDMNNDGVFNNEDIADFVAALTGP